MLVIFDKGLTSEKTIEMDNMFEYPLDNNMNLTKEIIIKEGVVIPDYAPLEENFPFTTLNVISGNGIEIPLAGQYNKVTGMSINYFDSEKRYSVNINLGKDTGEKEA
jgi:hypothetical protein